MLPFSAEHHLEVWYGKSVLHAAHAVKTEVAEMMLAARIETAAHFDVQTSDGFIDLSAALQEPLPKFGRKSSRGRNAQFACIGSRAGDYVHNASGARESKTCGLKFLVHSGKIGLAHPTKNDVLLNGGANCLSSVLTRDRGKRPQLIRGDIAERQTNGHGRITSLTLPVNVRVVPLLKLGVGRILNLKKLRRPERLLVRIRQML